MSIPASVLIAGGGMSGFQTASSLRDLGFTGTITIVDGGTEAPYDRPPLSKDYFLGKVTLAELEFAKPEWYSEKNVSLELGSRVASLDAAAGSITLENGQSLTADAVVLAFGGDARKLPLDNGKATNIHVLRTKIDADKLKNSIFAGTRLLIIGAGLIGAETASSAKKLGATVTLIDPFEPPIQQIVGLEIANYMHDHHALNDIRTIKGSISELVEDENGQFVAGITDAGERLEFDQLLVGIGIIPNTQIAVDAGLEVDNGILVDASHRTSAPKVFACGDVARTRRANGELVRRNEHWESARLSGEATARGIMGLPEEEHDSHWFWSDREGIHLEVAGDMTAEADNVWRGTSADESFVLFRVNGSALVGAASINDSMAVRAARRIIESGIAVNAAELADPAVNLRKLTRG
jgi:3-phenylpropionate/trans-cinnamate dioxygenase ferredoxin reductase subunit